ncbi:pyrimidine reductase family protein [Pseudonocardia endophytica]|uniref:Riboflavin biosynthesis pyrimidine reductase n=1 Tax=Pseudonocardia endophytica TaxID=401976 RepID=A0A4V2PIJ3_PSEEN|nr:pyrimidine reductase family protein [Pseudonocardia endophytica]TCK24906.1 riboflavin biosynthesis pyrimidine reductase [Pseudonocardia endophytica]
MEDDEIARRYAWPETDRPWVRAVMVSSLDGAVEAGGRSAGVATAADRRVFVRLRRSADVVLVGAGTVRAEDYRGVRAGADAVAPPIAVVSGSAALDPSSRLFSDTRTPPIVLTTAAAPRSRRDAIAAAGGDVVVLDDLGAASLLGELGRRGLRRVACEGGPRLLGSLLDDDAVDELCLTLSPVLVGGTAGRIAVSDAPTTRVMTVASLVEEDGTLLLRYVRESGASGITPPNG